MGAEIIEDVPMPNTRYGIPAYFVISRVEAASNLHRYDGVKYGLRADQAFTDLKKMYRDTRNEGFGLQPKLRILMGMYVSAAQYSEQYYQRALQVRTMIRRDFDEVFDPQGKYRLDALLTPTTPTTAFQMAAVYGDSVLMQYADQLDRAGQPRRRSGHLPARRVGRGKAAHRHPAVGRGFTEDKLFRIGRAYEMATADEPWRNVKPEVLRQSCSGDEK